LPPDTFLVDQLLAGNIDALLAYKPPKAFIAGDARIQRLYPDYGSCEEAFYRRTQVFPIMHLMGIRRDVVRENPDLPMALFDAFAKAKDSAIETLCAVQALGVSLPWLVQEVSRTSAIMGSDWWPYGIGRNRETLAAMLGYLHDQGLIDKSIPLTDLFHPTTHDT
jgi:4,5-dihydroxyphthalate decarboxylase